MIDYLNLKIYLLGFFFIDFNKLKVLFKKFFDRDKNNLIMLTFKHRSIKLSSRELNGFKRFNSFKKLIQILITSFHQERF